MLRKRPHTHVLGRSLTKKTYPLGTSVASSLARRHPRPHPAGALDLPIAEALATSAAAASVPPASPAPPPASFADAAELHRWRLDAPVSRRMATGEEAWEFGG